MSAVSFTTGCAVDEHVFYLSSHPDDLSCWDDFSRMYVYHHLEREWSSHDLEGWQVNSVVFLPLLNGVKRQVAALGSEGHIEFYGNDGIHYKKIEDAGVHDDQPYYGTMSRIRFIEGHLYAVGDKGQVYRHEHGDWVHRDDGILLPFGRPREALELILKDPEADTDHLDPTRTLLDIHGHHEHDLYACGYTDDGGILAHFDGAQWTIQSDTPAQLSAVALCPDGDVVVVGSAGSVLKGNAKTGFKSLNEASLEATFYTADYFNDELYIGAEQGLYKYTPQYGFEFLEINQRYALMGIGTVEAKGGVLWVLAHKTLLRFDGNHWAYIPHPDNLESED